MYNDLKTVVARPEGVHNSFVDKPLDSLTAQEPARETAPDLVIMANLGAVYFIRAGRMRAVKIGWAFDPVSRLAALQTASHHKLHLIGYVPGAVADEQEWHGRFRHLRIRGEWFNLVDELREAINGALFSGEGAVSYTRLSLDSVRAGARARRA